MVTDFKLLQKITLQEEGGTDDDDEDDDGIDEGSDDDEEEEDAEEALPENLYVDLEQSEESYE
ncbi:MAG: hypothetical protein Q7K44_04030 [Candidatus Liptonbacteria bacterium]|nr:hypothetical protein [Candidatus Liptonbacteria bacterium]